MDVLFDGEQRLIICQPGTTTLHAVALYSRWKEWVQQGTNACFLPAFSGSSGGNDLGGGVRLDAYLFVTNGWRIQPQASSHRLVIEGNLFPDPITAPLFCPPPGNHLIQIERYVTTRAVVVSSTGTTTPGDGGPVPTAAELAEAVWSQELPGGGGLMAGETLIRAQQSADLAVALGL